MDSIEDIFRQLLSTTSYANLLQILNEVAEEQYQHASNNFNEMKQIQEAPSVAPIQDKAIEIKVTQREEPKDVTVTKEVPVAANKKVLRKPRKTKIPV
jgi:hypothetical protein